MFKNYVIIAFRNLRLYKGYALINILGLAIGLACFLMAILYLQHELSFDNYHEKGKRIFRVVGLSGFAEKIWNPSTTGLLAPELRTSFSEIEDAVRLKSYGEQWIKTREQIFPDVSIMYGESNIFNIFSYDLVSGDPSTVLDRPNSAVVTRSISRRFFGESDPKGRILELEHNGEVQPFEITGLMEDVPANSHFRFQVALSFESLLGTRLSIDANQFTTFALVAQSGDPLAIARQIQTYVHDTLGKDYVIDSALQPLSEIYFSDIYAQRQGDMRYILILSAIALLILAIACANYMSLATARSVRRTQEVGIRKVMGAQRRQLIGQFLTEAWLLTLAALPAALIILKLALPQFNSLVQTEMDFVLKENGQFMLVIVSVLVVVGAVAGSYPALFLSAFQPVEVIRRRLKIGFPGAALRRLLVVFQFSASIALIICTAIILRQLNFVQARYPGFEVEQIVLIKITDQEMARQADALKQAFLRHSAVLAASAAGSALPGQQGFGSIRFIDYPQGKDGPAITFVNPSIDSDFLETMQIPLIAGRNISDRLPEDNRPEALTNRTTLEIMGWETPEEALGKEIANCRIVGVVHDFNFASLHLKIQPLLMEQNSTGRARTIALRVRPGDIPGTLTVLKKTWEEFNTAMQFDFAFLTDEMNALYEREQRNAKVFGLFASLAIIIACMGLFGLSAFIADQRTKEIGIRKILGAGIPDIILLLSRNFVLMVITSFVVAVPIAFLVMSHWLEKFAYRVRLDPGIFIMTGVSALLIAILTISMQSVRAALSNPVESLRQE